MELPVGLPHGGLAAAGLPLCGGDGSAAAAPSAVGRPSSLRGVASHNGSRYESHVWSAGRQVYLGGFYDEALAATAYDLASVLLRGFDATTNAPLDAYSAELAVEPKPSLDQLVAHLRSQAKALARIDATAGARSASAMEPWEQGLLRGMSEAVGGHTSLGVFATEADAARAVDRALLQRDGLQAAASLSLPLVDYLPLLDAAQIAEALQSGLLPLNIPRTYRPADEPQPLLPPIACTLPTPTAPLPTCSAAGAAACDGGMAPPLPAPVPRKASMTPRLSAADLAPAFSPFNTGF